MKFNEAELQRLWEEARIARLTWLGYTELATKQSDNNDYTEYAITMQRIKALEGFWGSIWEMFNRLGTPVGGPV